MTSQTGTSEDAVDPPETLNAITRAIEQLQRAISFTSEDTPHAAFHAVHFDRLADLYFSRYVITEEEDDLGAAKKQSAHATALGILACAIAPPGHSKVEQWYALQGDRLMTRYGRFGEQKDLGDAIQAYEQALKTVPEFSPLHSIILTNQANCLCTRYESEGNGADINSAITKAQLALALAGAGTNVSTVKNDLSTMHLSKFEKEGNPEDLDRAVLLARQAVDITPESDHRRTTRLLNLANGLRTLFQQHEEFRYIEETVHVLKKAESAGRRFQAPCLPQILFQLADALHIRYDRDKSDADVYDAINRLEGALKLLEREGEQSELTRRVQTLLSTCYEEADTLVHSVDE